MLAEIPHSLFALWKADYELDPWDRIDAQIAAALHENTKAIDFIPILKDAPRGEDDGTLMKMQVENRALSQEVDE